MVTPGKAPRGLRPLVGAAWLAVSLVPLVVFTAVAFDRRWMNEDGFINLRIVRNILEGHGFVYNVGERVEAGTSPLWIFILTLLGSLGARLEHAAVYAGLVLTVAGLALGQWGALMLAEGTHPTLSSLRRRLVIPLGAGIFAVLPPAWDFAASGLETGLIIVWLGGSFLMMARLAVGKAGPLGWLPCAVVVGLGPLVRPELTLFIAGFLAVLCMGLWDRVGGRWAGVRWVVLLLAAAGALPVAYEIFRMGYFALLTPNTGLTKEAFTPHWIQGGLYALNFFGLYWLPLPMAAVTLVWVQDLGRTWSARTRMLAGTAIAPVVCAGLYSVYVVRVGGDFMHGRMFLPAMAGFLLPVAMVPLRLGGLSCVGGAARLLAVAVALAWMPVCGIAIRVSSENVWGIGDERGWYTRLAGCRNPIALEDYHRFDWYVQTAHILDVARTHCARLEEQGRSSECDRMLYLVTDFQRLHPPVKRYPVGGSVHPGISMVTQTGAIGMAGYLLGPEVHLVDERGLSDPVAARMKLLERRRPGHEKTLSEPWIIARFTDHWDGEDAGITWAREAMGCGDLGEVLDAVTGPLTLRRFIRNVARSFRLQFLRLEDDPLDAAIAFCGMARPYEAIAGGAGGAPYRWDCPVGYVLARITGSTGEEGEHVSFLKPQCYRLRVQGGLLVHGFRPRHGHPFGHRGIASIALECPADELPVGLHGRSDRYVGRVGLVCAKVEDVGELFHVGEKIPSETAGSGEGESFQLECPAGTVLSGMIGRAGSFVDAVGIVCRPLPSEVGGSAREGGGQAGTAGAD